MNPGVSRSIGRNRKLDDGGASASVRRTITRAVVVAVPEAVMTLSSVQHYCPVTYLPTWLITNNADGGFVTPDSLTLAACVCSVAHSSEATGPRANLILRLAKEGL